MGNSSSRNEMSSGLPSSGTKNSSSLDEKMFSGWSSSEHLQCNRFSRECEMTTGSPPSSKYSGYNEPKSSIPRSSHFDWSRYDARILMGSPGYMPHFKPYVRNSSSSDEMPINSGKEEETVIITRKDWGGLEPTKVTNRSKPAKRVVFHHAATPSSSDTEVNKKRVRSIQNYHMVQRGWDDIGYNFLIGEDGQIYEGRGINAVGAHAKGFNSTSIGISVMGNYSSEEPPEAVKKAIPKLLKYLADQGVMAENCELTCHKDLADTECPAKLSEFIKTVSKPSSTKTSNGK